MINQKFRNKKAILIATGPSLTEEVVDIIRKYKNDFVIFGCNDSYRIVDFLDIHYACDTAWWNIHAEPFREKYPFLETWTQSKEHKNTEFNLNVIKGGSLPGLSLKSDFIHWGSNSGYQLLNIAFLMGCCRFILVGYNMQQVNGQRHYFGEHPESMKRNSPYPAFVKAFSTIQPEIKELIINCTPDSALTIFPYQNLEEVLAW
jgi:hypothetical protein